LVKGEYGSKSAWQVGAMLCNNGFCTGKTKTNIYIYNYIYIIILYIYVYRSIPVNTILQFRKINTAKACKALEHLHKQWGIE
jgi:hypothetical protein